MQVSTGFRLLSPQPLETQYVVKFRTDLDDFSPYNYDGWHRYCQEDQKIYVCHAVGNDFVWEPLDGATDFKEWIPGQTYERGDLIVYDTVCYEVDFTFTASDSFTNDRFQLTEYISRDGENNFSFIIRKQDWVQDLDSNLFYYTFGHKWEDTNMIFDFWDNDTRESIIIAYEMTSEDITDFWTNQLFNCVVNVNFGTVNDDTITNRIEHLMEHFEVELEKLREKDVEHDDKFNDLEPRVETNEINIGDMTTLNVKDNTDVKTTDIVSSLNVLYENQYRVVEVDILPTIPKENIIYLLRKYKLDTQLQPTTEIEYYVPYTLENGLLVSWHRPLKDDEIIKDWEPNTLYKQDELIVYKNVCYIANATFTSGADFETGTDLVPYIGLPYAFNRTFKILEADWTEDQVEELYFFDYEHDLPLDYLGLNFFFESLDTGDSVFIATDKLDNTHYRFWTNFPDNVQVTVDTGYCGDDNNIDTDEVLKLAQTVAQHTLDINDLKTLEPRVEALELSQVQQDNRLDQLELLLDPNLEQRVTDLETNQGDLTTLKTANKRNLVDAFNELFDTVPATKDIVGNPNDMQTTTKDTVVEGINELYYLKQNKFDDRLTTTDQTVVGAINELNDKITTEVAEAIEEIKGEAVLSPTHTVREIVVMTKAEYTALNPKVDTTIYIIVG